MPFSTAHPSLQTALTRREYSVPTPVQAAVLAEDAKDRDLLVSAQTGSGKTVAFGLAFAPLLLGDAARFPKAGQPLALIVTPTRELAQQVHRELAWLYADTGARITTCVGGMDPRREHQALSQGVHIVVGTPGRLCDHLERRALVLSQLQALVLDEADEMLDMGFREDLERLLDAAPPTRRTLLFSATIPKDIAAIAKRYQKNALRISTQSETVAHRDIEYHAIPIVQRERDLAVVNLLRYHEAGGALVFCNTRDAVTHLTANLNERGFSVAALSGELSQRERNTALQALRDGRARVCVATDVAARGLDLPDLGLVIHADLPQNKQTLVHRSGRTGRAGKRGVAILLVPDNARRYVERTLQSAHVVAQWMKAPTAEQIWEKDQEQLVREIGTLTEDLNEDDREVARTLLAERSAEDLVTTLVRQLRQSRPAPEVLTEPSSARPRRPEPRGPIRPSGPSGFGRTDQQRGRQIFQQDRGPHGGRDDRGPRPDDRSPRPDDRGPRPDARGPRPPFREQQATEVRGPRPDERAPFRAERTPFRAERTPDTRERRPYREERPVPEPRRPASGPQEDFASKAQGEHTHPAPIVATADRANIPTAPIAPAAAEAPGGGAAGDAAWFTINVGRSKNADPKWLVPLLCRRGGITKREIGKIQILARETRVEIAADARDRFAEAVRRPDPKDRNIHIEPLDAL